MRQWLTIGVIISAGLPIVLAVKCSYCNKEFASLGRHTWRCTSRVTSTSSIHGTPAVPTANNTIAATGQPCNPTIVINCICGKACKGRRGLKAHQRSCKTLSVIGANEESDVGGVTDGEGALEGGEAAEGREVTSSARVAEGGGGS